MGRFLCRIFGHRWHQPEGVLTRRSCRYCGALPHTANGRSSDG